MNFANISNKLVNSKWAMNKHCLLDLYKRVNQLQEMRSGGFISKLFGNPVLASSMVEVVPAVNNKIEDEESNAGDIAIISINGTIVKGANKLEQETLGLVNTDEIAEAIKNVAEDETIQLVIFHITSHGGEVTGIEELARKIKALDSVKPCVCWVDSAMQSAAYWIGSQCRLIGMAPSSEVGSIGVRLLIMDISEQLKKNGINAYELFSGKYKTMGSELKPLTEEETTILNNGITKTHNKFKDAVLSSRPNVNQDVMEGLSYEGDEALENNLVDLVTDDFDSFLEEITK